MDKLSLTFSYYKRKLKLTNGKIAEMSGIPVQTIERISSGRTANPNLKTLKALAAVFECSLDDLMNLRDTTRPYYFDENTAKIAQLIQNDETLSTLFTTFQLLTEENKQAVTGLAERLMSIQEREMQNKGNL